MRKGLWFVGVIVLFVCSGCSTQHSWVYMPNKYNVVKPEIDKTASILPFSDERTNENTNHGYLYLIPLVPFGSVEYSVPEGATDHITSTLWMNFKPTEDFPKALSEELRSAKIFKDVYFDFKKGDSEITIIGKIKSTNYDGKVISYGLSFYGSIFWLIGFPAGSFNNELVVDLSCIDSKTEKVIFSKTYTAEPYSKWVWIYTLPGDFQYSNMLQKVYKNFVEDLRGVLKNQKMSSVDKKD